MPVLILWLVRRTMASYQQHQLQVAATAAAASAAATAPALEPKRCKSHRVAATKAAATISPSRTSMASGSNLLYIGFVGIVMMRSIALLRNVTFQDDLPGLRSRSLSIKYAPEHPTAMFLQPTNVATLSKTTTAPTALPTIAAVAPATPAALRSDTAATMSPNPVTVSHHVSTPQSFVSSSAKPSEGYHPTNSPIATTDTSSPDNLHNFTNSTHYSTTSSPTVPPPTTVSTNPPPTSSPTESSDTIQRVLSSQQTFANETNVPTNSIIVTMSPTVPPSTLAHLSTDEPSSAPATNSPTTASPTTLPMSAVPVAKEPVEATTTTTTQPLLAPVTAMPTGAPETATATITTTTTDAPTGSTSSPIPQPQSQPTSPSLLPIVEFNDCRTLAPCHVDGDDSNLTCAVFYAQRFWQSPAVPQHLRDELRYQHENRPINCWYETELLQLTKLANATSMPYKNAVCRGNGNAIPDHLVYWHNFKVAGTTARNALGLFGFPNYERARQVFSDQLKQLFPQRVPIYANYSDYLHLVDELKHQAYERQLQNGQANLGFTFVRSPVQRFLSGLEQIQRLNNNWWEVSPEARPCFEIANAVTKVECVVDAITNTRVFFNVHVYPQSYLFDVWTKQGTYDLTIHVLDLQSMDPLFKRFKGKIVRRVRVSTPNNTKLHLIDHNLEPGLLKKICRLYQADLLMLQAMQMEDPLCAEALSSS